MFLTLEGVEGSGKSTLKNILGCLDIPTYGTYYLNGQAVSDMKPSTLSGIRNREIGFIFQFLLKAPAELAVLPGKRHFHGNFICVRMAAGQFQTGFRIA